MKYSKAKYKTLNMREKKIFELVEIVIEVDGSSSIIPYNDKDSQLYPSDVTDVIRDDSVSTNEII